MVRRRGPEQRGRRRERWRGRTIAGDVVLCLFLFLVLFLSKFPLSWLYSIPSRFWICTRDTPLVSGITNHTQNSCPIMHTTYKAHVYPPDFASIIGQIQEM